jgi:hypothetical protein
MGYSKRQFVEAAFEEIGLASYVFDLTPQQIESACRRLDAMMASWNALGIRLGYPLPGSPQATGLDDETNVPDAAYEAIITNLGIKLAPSYGKTVSADTKTTAKRTYDTLLSRAAMPMEMQLPASMPRGAGAKAYDDPFVDNPTEPILAGRDGPLEF